MRKIIIMGIALVCLWGHGNAAQRQRNQAAASAAASSSSASATDAISHTTRRDDLLARMAGAPVKEPGYFKPVMAVLSGTTVSDLARSLHANNKFFEEADLSVMEKVMTILRVFFNRDLSIIANDSNLTQAKAVLSALYRAGKKIMPEYARIIIGALSNLQKLSLIEAENLEALCDATADMGGVTRSNGLAHYAALRESLGDSAD